MCIVATSAAPNTTPRRPPDCPAHHLTPHQRQQLAVEVLVGQSVAELAQQHDVSRPFVYRQAEQARLALDQAFRPPAPAKDTILFQLPVTRAWLRQFILSLVLIGHSPLRGVQEILRDLFDHDLALGTIHNVVHEAVTTARTVNATQDLSQVRIAAQDEIFQHGQPVLVGVDARSTYCYLLSQERQRDADTWAIHLWDLQRQQFAPEAFIADFAKGLRAGQRLACPDVPARGDVFHAEYDFGKLVRFLENRAYTALTAVVKLEQQLARPRPGPSSAAADAQLTAARVQAEAAVALADDVAVLERWLREDLLTVAGPALAERRQLVDFLVAELRLREAQCPHRIAPLRTLLANQRDQLLAFVAALDEDIAQVARTWQLAPRCIRELLAVQALPWASAAHWQRQAALRAEIGAERWPAVQGVVTQLAAAVVRASSVVENLNSRLRNYFFLRRHLGADYLDLLRFFLNHRRFQRSEHAERVEQSPRELLTGQEHGHWLELLGYERFRRAG